MEDFVPTKKHRGCSCIQTAIILVDENEFLRKKIKILEKKVTKYQTELLSLYSSGSDTNSSGSRLITPGSHQCDRLDYFM